MSALDYAEPALARAYTRELDQEENIWRSLPTLVAALALSLTALSQVLGRLAELTGWSELCAVFALVEAAVFGLGGLTFTVLAIYPVSFRYVFSDLVVFTYAKGLDDGSIVPAASGLRSDAWLRQLLAEQCARATDYNREVNLQRGRLRSIAGLCTMCAVLFSFLLVGVIFWHHLWPVFYGADHAVP